MIVRMSGELKSPREQTATVEITWDPSDAEQDHVASLLASMVDIVEKYLSIKRTVDKEEP